MSHVCEWCKVEFTPSKNTNGFFCSEECSQKSHFCDNFLDWYYHTSSKQQTRTIKSYLLTIHGNICSNHQKSPSICIGNISLMDEMPLVVDHIDGNFLNNQMDNVRLMCPNCHSLTDNYKNKNKLGRFKRLKGVI